MNSAATRYAVIAAVMMAWGAVWFGPVFEYGPDLYAGGVWLWSADALTLMTWVVAIIVSTEATVRAVSRWKRSNGGVEDGA